MRAGLGVRASTLSLAYLLVVMGAGLLAISLLSRPDALEDGDGKGSRGQSTVAGEGSNLETPVASSTPIQEHVWRVPLSQEEISVDIGALVLGGKVLVSLMIENDTNETSPPLGVFADCTCQTATQYIPALEPGGKARLDLLQESTQQGETQSVLQFLRSDGTIAMRIILRAELSKGRFIANPIMVLPRMVANVGSTLVVTVVDGWQGDRNDDNCASNVRPPLPSVLEVHGELQGRLHLEDWAPANPGLLRYRGEIRGREHSYGALRGEYRLPVGEGKWQHGWVLADVQPPWLSSEMPLRTRLWLDPAEQRHVELQVPERAIRHASWVDDGRIEPWPVDIVLLDDHELHVLLLNDSLSMDSSRRLRLELDQGEFLLTVGLGSSRSQAWGGFPSAR